MRPIRAYLHLVNAAALLGATAYSIATEAFVIAVVVALSAVLAGITYSMEKRALQPPAPSNGPTRAGRGLGYHEIGADRRQDAGD